MYQYGVLVIDNVGRHRPEDVGCESRGVNEAGMQSETRARVRIKMLHSVI